MKRHYFSDQPDKVRDDARAIVQDNGGHVCGYFGPYLQVALPNTGAETIRCRFAQLGLRQHNAFYFPADTGSPKRLIHRRGYWLHANFAAEVGAA